MIPLRPLGLGEILDGAISYIRAHPKATLGLSAVVLAIVQLVSVPAQRIYFDGLGSLSTENAGNTGEVLEAVGGGVVTQLFATLLAFIATTVLTGMLIVVISRSVLGQSISIGETWHAVLPRLPGLIGLSLLIAIVLSVPLGVAVVAIVVPAVAGASPFVPLVIGLILVPVAIVAMVYLWVTLAMAAPAYVLEGGGVFEALTRSHRLVRPGFWRIFGILLLATLIAVALQTILAAPFGLVGGAVDGLFSASANPATFTPSLLALILGAIGAIIAGTITTPFNAGVTGLLYIDQRIRREAFDIELARAADTGG